MDHIEGFDLVELIENSERSERRLLHIFKKVIKILIQLRDNGIAHCDIKPENIMITSEGEIKLVDFGFASELQEYGFLNKLQGTPHYMAPEIWESQFGKSYQGTDADLFALGVTLFVAQFKGSLPFEKAEIDNQFYMSLIERSINGVDSWTFYSQFFSPELRNLIVTMLQLEPSARLSITDLIGHAWVRGQAMSEEEFLADVAGLMTRI